MERLEDRHLLAVDVLFPVIDGYASDTAKNGSFSTVDTTDNRVQARLYPASPGYPGEDRGLLEFDVAGFGAGVTIDEAEFGFQLVLSWGAAPKEINVFAYAADGVINSVDATAAAQLVGSASGLVFGTYYKVPLDSDVLDALAESANHIGLRMHVTEASRDAGGNGLGIYSMEGAVNLPERRPTLTLTSSGTPTPGLTLAVNPTTAVENAGAGAATGTVQRINADTSGPLTVSLASNDSSEAVPADGTVTILAGQASATFAINVVDDTELDGSQTVTFTATAAGFSDGTASLVVTDHETLTLDPADSEILESAGPGATTVTVTRSTTDLSAALNVTLTSLNPSQLSVPATAVIPVGAASVGVPVDPIDDEVVDGNARVRIRAAATGYVTGETEITVQDDDGGRVRPGNILVAAEDRYVYEYKPDGTLIQTFPFFSQGSQLRDLVVNQAGDIEVINGSSVLTTIDVETKATTNHTAPDWGTIGNVFSGGAARHGQYIFVSDGGGSSSPRGVVRFDTANGYASTHISADFDVADVAVGLDGLLYALQGGVSPSHKVSVYDPATLQKLRDVELPRTTHYGLAVNAAGEIFASAWGDTLYKYDAAGNLVDWFVTGFPVKDIDLDGSGRLVASAAATSLPRSYVVVTDESFQTVSTFSPTDGLELFVAFADPDYATAKPVVTTSSTPTVLTENGSSPVSTAVFIDANLQLADDGDVMTGAVVRITGNYRQGEDSLSYFSANGIFNGGFDANTGTLKMYGTASVAAYQAALRSVSYVNSSNSPDTGPRAITISALDEGWVGSGVATVQVVSSNDGSPAPADDNYTVDEDQVLAIPVVAASRLTMKSDPGEFIGQGGTYNLTSGTFSVRQQFGTRGVEIRYQGSTSSDYWDLEFWAPVGQVLQVGSYPVATRDGSNGTARLEISGQGRGSNRLVGSFVVHQVAYDAGGSLTRFAASFVQHNEAQLPALRGTLNYRATYNTVSGVLLNDADVDGGRLTVTGASTPGNGSVSMNPDGTFVYTPHADFFGADSFVYTVVDSDGATATATVNITVNNVPDDPVATNPNVTTPEDTAVTGIAATDADGDALTFALLSGPSNGSVEFQSDGSFTYTPQANFFGSDAFAYVARGGGGAASGNASITVTPVDDPPVIGTNSFTTDEDTPLAGQLSASDIDSSTLTYALSEQAAHGSVAVNPDGSFTYTPAADYFGPDAFNFTVSDGTTTVGGTATITVVAVNDAPAVDDATFSLDENSANGTTVGTVSATDAEDDPMTYAITGGDTGAFAINAATGTISVADASQLDYEVTPQFTLTVTVTDNSGAAGTATVVINLNDVLEVAIDVLPDDPDNTVQLGAKEIEVAVLATASFDPLAMLDLSTVRFGATGSGVSAGVAVHRKTGYKVEQRDVDGDGLLDLVLRFKTSETGLQVGDTSATLSGRLKPEFGATEFATDQAVSVVEGKGGGNGGGKGNGNGKGKK